MTFIIKMLCPKILRISEFESDSSGGKLILTNPIIYFIMK